MSEPTASRLGRTAAWLITPALLAVAYFATYYATVSPVDTRIRIRSGSTQTVRLEAPEPEYAINSLAGAGLSTEFWQRFFGPAWRVDRVMRPGVWRERHASRE